MQGANRSVGRALSALTLGCALAVAGPSTVEAQTSATSAVAAISEALNQDATVAIQRATLLVDSGEHLLRDARDADARQAFDAALDLFVNLRADQKADPGVQAAYETLVSRIMDAEAAAKDLPRQIPAAVPPLSIRAEALTPLTVEQDQAPAATLDELGARIEGVTPTAEVREANAAVLGTEQIDLPIQMNDQVLGAIDLYSGRFRSWFSRALSRGIPHLPRIREILSEAGIPQDLAYVPIVESAFNPTALSRAKAKGVWQFIPSTGKQYGLKQDFFVDERSNIEKATFAAAQYLKNLYAMFGDWNLALAGYNAGEGNVQKAIKRAKTNDFWALAKTRSFRSETKNYVPLIHAAIVIAKSPESYGIDLTPEELAAAETIQVKGSYAISTVARCANTEASAIRQMNPELRRAMTPSTAFDLRVPHGSGQQTTACLANERAMNYTRHVVRKRDTLSSIAKTFGVPSSEIARVNGLTTKARLRPGVELAIPRASRPAAKAVAVASTGRPRGPSAPPGHSYRIRKGDTLSHVADRFNTSVAAIKALNGLRSSRLSIGQVLRIVPPASEVSPE